MNSDGITGTAVRFNQVTKICFVCQHFENFKNASHRPTEKHHIFHGTANRALAEEDGLWVYLCPEHHREGKAAVHGGDCENYDAQLKRLGQQAYEEKLREAGKTVEEAREAFRARYGRSWL